MDLRLKSNYFIASFLLRIDSVWSRNPDLDLP
jgi:hypothetical protein